MSRQRRLPSGPDQLVLVAEKVGLREDDRPSFEINRRLEITVLRQTDLKLTLYSYSSSYS